MKNFCLLKSGIFFFPKKLYETVVTNNTTCSPKWDTLVSLRRQKMIPSRILIIPVQAGWQKQKYFRNILIFHAFLKAETPHLCLLPTQTSPPEAKFFWGLAAHTNTSLWPWVTEILAAGRSQQQGELQILPAPLLCTLHFTSAQD